MWHEETRSQLLEGQGAAEREDGGRGQPSSAAFPAVRWADRKALATVLSLVGRTLWNCGDREAGGGGGLVYKTEASIIISCIQRTTQSHTVLCKTVTAGVLVIHLLYNKPPQNLGA